MAYALIAFPTHWALLPYTLYFPQTCCLLFRYVILVPHLVEISDLPETFCVNAATWTRTVCPVEPCVPCCPPPAATSLVPPDPVTQTKLCKAALQLCT